MWKFITNIDSEGKLPSEFLISEIITGINIHKDNDENKIDF